MDGIEPHAALAPTAALLGAQIAVGAAIEQLAVDASRLDSTTSDLLLRLSMSPSGSLRGVDLCRQLQLSPSYVSRRIDRAEADGFVRRQPDPTDRRAQLVSLTDEGRRAIDEFTPHLLATVERIVADLSPPEVDTLIDLLGRMERAAISLVTATSDSATA